MEDLTREATEIVEAGYWLSHSWPSGFLLFLSILLIVTSCYVFYQRITLAEQKRLINQLREGADTFRYLVETAHEGIAVVQDARLVYLNPRMCEMSGYNEDELKELSSFMPLIHPSARDEMMANYQRRVAGEFSPKRYESLFLRKDGSSYPIELSGVAIVWGGEPATLNILTDISARKAAENKVIYLAHHDSLTGLVNRTVFTERLKHTISLAQRSHATFAVVFIDLNKFKQINDTYGHDVGDMLLQQVSTRINQQLRDTDTLARFGGDEFVILLAHAKNNQEVQQVMKRIKEAMIEPFQIKNHHLHCYVSQGGAVYPKDGTTVEELLSLADKNMYAEKLQLRLH